MANNLLNQPLDINLESFPNAVKRLMKEKGITQAKLAERSGLDKQAIYRICHNRNSRGGEYIPTESVVMAISVGLGLSSTESREQLLYAAFPERKHWDSFLDNHLSIKQINDILDENGLATLTNAN